MSSLASMTTPDPILYRTKDFEVLVGTSDAADLPLELKRLFFIRHTSTQVVAGRTNHLSEALYGVEEVQQALEAAIKNPKKRPERELSRGEQAALLSLAHGGTGN